MFTNSSITSNLGSALVSYSYDDHYLFGSNIVPTGLDHSEYYFMVRDTYEQIEKDVLDIHEQYLEQEGVLKPKLVSCIEDPILVSSDHKYVIYLRTEFGHFVLNTLVNIALIHEANPEAVFVIFMDLPDENDPEIKKSIRFLEKFLANHSMNFYFIRSSYFLENMSTLGVNAKSPLSKKFKILESSNIPIAHYLVYKVNNVSVVNSGDTTRDLTIKDITFLIDKYINDFSDPVEKPERKVYITRRVYDSGEDALVEGGYSSNNIRIYNEELLENYLLSNGFEIVDFKELTEIQDQINLMRGTSVLIGATGTGLTNQLFMQESQVLVEFRVEHGNAESKHWIPNEYFYLSSGKNHVHILIDVKDKQASTAIERLDRLISLYDLNTLTSGWKS